MTSPNVVSTTIQSEQWESVIKWTFRIIAYMSSNCLYTIINTDLLLTVTYRNWILLPCTEDYPMAIELLALPALVWTVRQNFITLSTLHHDPRAKLPVEYVFYEAIYSFNVAPKPESKIITFRCVLESILYPIAHHYFFPPFQ